MSADHPVQIQTRCLSERWCEVLEPPQLPGTVDKVSQMVTDILVTWGPTEGQTLSRQGWDEAQGCLLLEDAEDVCPQAPRRSKAAKVGCQGSLGCHIFSWASGG